MEIDSPIFMLDLKGTIAILGKSLEPCEISIFNLASIDRAFISTIENGKRNLSISVLHKIATNLDSNISEIFKD